jgi:hypothetical protein
MIEMKMNTSPKPANRRIEERSVVARDSSWPDCHSSWNAGSSRCRCWYRSSLIACSMPDRQQAERQEEAALVVGDGAVDDDLGDERDHDFRARGDDGGQQQQRQPIAVRAQVRMQPPEGGDWAGGHRVEPNWHPDRCHLVFSVGNCPQLRSALPLILIVLEC